MIWIWIIIIMDFLAGNHISPNMILDVCFLSDFDFTYHSKQLCVCICLIICILYLYFLAEVLDHLLLNQLLLSSKLLFVCLFICISNLYLS